MAAARSWWRMRRIKHRDGVALCVLSSALLHAPHRGQPPRLLLAARDAGHGAGQPPRDHGPHGDGPVRPPPEEARPGRLAALASGPQDGPGGRAPRAVAAPLHITMNCAWGTPPIHRTPSSATNPPRFTASPVSRPTTFPIVASRRWARSWSSVPA